MNPYITDIDVKESIKDVNKFIYKLHKTVLKENPILNPGTNKHSPMSAPDLIKMYSTDYSFKSFVDNLREKSIELEIEKYNNRLLKKADAFVDKIMKALDKPIHGGKGNGDVIHYYGKFQTDQWYYVRFYEWVNTYSVKYIPKKHTDIILSKRIKVIKKERSKRLDSKLPKILFSNEK